MQDRHEWKKQKNMYATWYRSPHYNVYICERQCLHTYTGTPSSPMTKDCSINDTKESPIQHTYGPQTRINDPPNATWFKWKDNNGVGPMDQMIKHADLEGHALAVARDYWGSKTNSKGVREDKIFKMYTSFPTCEDFLSNTLLSSDTSFMYEVIPENHMCKLHFDVEWTITMPPDFTEAGKTLTAIINIINQRCQRVLGLTPRFIVSKGSRAVGNQKFKHSYHIICPNIVFESNAGGMKAFVHDLVQENQDKEVLWYIDKNGTRKCSIDTTIYNKNRCFRTENSCKLDDLTMTCLKRVRLDYDGIWHDCTEALSITEYIDAFVTIFPDDFNAKQSMIPDPTQLADNGKRKRDLVGDHPQTHHAKKNKPSQESPCVQRLQELVDKAGGVGCTVVSQLPDDTDGKLLRFQCRNDMHRTCLVTEGSVHMNNNCFLTVETPTGVVRYRCHAAECKDKRDNSNRKGVKIGVMVDEGTTSGDDMDHEDTPSDVLEHEEEDGTTFIQREFTACASRFKPAPAPDSSIYETTFPYYLSMESVEYMLSLGVLGMDCHLSTGVVLPSVDGETLPNSLFLEDIDYKRLSNVRCTNCFVSTEVAFPSMERRTFYDSLSLEDIECMLLSKLQPSYPMAKKTEYENTEYEIKYKTIGIFQPSSDNLMHPANLKSEETQTDLIPTTHLVPPKDENDDRPVEYKVNMYIKGIRQPEGKKMHKLKVRGVCLAIADVCRSNPDNNKISTDSLMDMFRKCQMMKEDDSRLTLHAPSMPYLTPEYAMQLLQKWYLDDNPDFFESEMDTYNSVKKRIECTYFKNEIPFNFIQLDSVKIGKYNAISQDTIRGARRNTYYYEHREITKKDSDNENPEYQTTRRHFIDKWLNDPKILTTHSLCFNPSRPHGLIPTDNNSLLYNTWTGFAAEKIMPVSETVEKEAMDVFYGHVRKCMEEKAADYIMDYIANMFQRPCSKTKVAILLQGVEGCGKGTIFDTVRKIMGDQASFQTGKPTQDLFSRFSQGFKNKVLVQVTPTLDILTLVRILT